LRRARDRPPSRDPMSEPAWCSCYGAMVAPCADCGDCPDCCLCAEFEAAADAEEAAEWDAASGEAGA